MLEIILLFFGMALPSNDNTTTNYTQSQITSDVQSVDDTGGETLQVPIRK